MRHVTWNNVTSPYPGTQALFWQLVTCNTFLKWYHINMAQLQAPAIVRSYDNDWLRHLVLAARLFTVSILVLHLSPPAIAQEPAGGLLKFDRVLDLGKEITLGFAQDEKGYLWIGTTTGLVRYDGHDIRLYQAGPGSLSSPLVYVIEKDAADPAILWLSTFTGLNRFDTRTQTFRAFQANPEDPDSLPSNIIQHIVQDRGDPNIIWLGTPAGLSRFDKRSETFANFFADPDDPHSLSGSDVWTLLDDPHDPNTLWIGTWGWGLSKLDKAGGTFANYRHDPDDPHSLGVPEDTVYSIEQDKNDPDVLWIPNYNEGLDKFNKSTGRVTRYRHDPDNPRSLREGGVSFVHDDGRGSLWLCAEDRTDKGLTRFDKAAETFTNYMHDPNNPSSLSSNQLVRVYEDRAGILWVASLSGQIDKYDPQNQNFQTGFIPIGMPLKPFTKSIGFFSINSDN